MALISSSGSQSRDPLREQVGHDADDQQDRGEVEQRGSVQVADGAGELVGDHRRLRVAALEEVHRRRRDAADHLRHRDRLTDRAAESEHARRGDPGARRRQDDAADHLPASCAERFGAVSQFARDGQEEVARERGDDRYDHDRQHDDRREERVADGSRLAEDRDPAEGGVQPRLDVGLEERADQVDADQADDDARDRGEHLHQRPDHRGHPAGRHQREEQADRDAEDRRRG